MTKKTALEASRESSDPVILSRAEHTISRKQIDEEAIKVLYRLYRNGFKAYLVGGAVRDLLIGKKPKDFDVVTDAHPGQVKKLFSNCLLIGRRFRLAHIRFKGGKIVEVATFRKEPEGETEDHHDQNNSFGTPREDAFRRDITINALFYDISDFSIIDYVGGLKDIQEKRVCMIGDPHQRYVEDPVRIWRVVRHAARLGFSIEERTGKAIEQDRDLLCTCSGARMFEELNKDLVSGHAAQIISLLRSYGVLPNLFGRVGQAMQEDEEQFEALAANLNLVDSFVSSKKPLFQDIVYTLLLWPWAQKVLKEAGNGRDMVEVLADELQTSGMTITIPKALKANITQTIAIVERMFQAMNTGRMRWSLKKRARYKDASIVFSLLSSGEHGEPPDPFGRAFRERHPSSSGPWNKKRKRWRGKRRGKRPEGSSHSTVTP